MQTFRRHGREAPPSYAWRPGTDGSSGRVPADPKGRRGAVAPSLLRLSRLLLQPPLNQADTKVYIFLRKSITFAHFRSERLAQKRSLVSSLAEFSPPAFMALPFQAPRHQTTYQHLLTPEFGTTLTTKWEVCSMVTLQTKRSNLKPRPPKVLAKSNGPGLI